MQPPPPSSPELSIVQTDTDPADQRPHPQPVACAVQDRPGILTARTAGEPGRTTCPLCDRPLLLSIMPVPEVRPR